MPTLTAGAVDIPYQIRHSRRAKRIRIRILPGKVELVVPVGVDEDLALDFLDSKRVWVKKKTRALRELGMDVIPERFVSGEPVLFRGEQVLLSIEPVDRFDCEVRVESSLVVDVPASWTPEQREAAARRTVLAWLRERTLDDAQAYVQRHVETLGRAPKAVHVKDQKTLWGSCSPDGVIRLNWRLVAAPRQAFEYVVVHELCHLRERNHGPRFWEWVGRLMPGYEDHRAWLRRHGVALG